MQVFSERSQPNKCLDIPIVLVSRCPPSYSLVQSPHELRCSLSLNCTQKLILFFHSRIPASLQTSCLIGFDLLTVCYALSESSLTPSRQGSSIPNGCTQGICTKSTEDPSSLLSCFVLTTHVIPQ